MEIEVGNVIKTPHRRLEVLGVTYASVFVRSVEYQGAGKEIYTRSGVLSLCYTGIWSLEKATKQLDMSVLEEL